MKHINLSFVCLLAAVVCLQAAPAYGDDPIPPHKRVLTLVQQTHVENLKKEIEGLVNAGKLPDALKLAEELFQIRAAALGDHHWETVIARIERDTLGTVSRLSVEDWAAFVRSSKLSEEGLALNQKGMYAQAQAPLEEALAIHRRLFGEDHAKTAISYNQVASNLDDRGKHLLAGPLYHKTLAIRRKVYGEEHPGTAESYGNLAYNLNAQAKHAEAEPHFRRCLAIRQTILGENHPQTAGSYNNLAANLAAQSRHAEAGPLFHKALTIRRLVLGEEHPDTATSYNNVASNQLAQGKLAAAQALFEKSLAIRRKVLGEEHAVTVVGYTNLASNLSAQGKVIEAQPLYAKSLLICRRVLGEEHPRTALSYNKMASNLSDQGMHADAGPFYEKALVIRRMVLGEEHSSTANSFNDLAMNLNRQGKHKEAEPLHQKALAISRKVLGEEHPDTATSYNNVAYNLHAQGKYAEAELLLQKALAIRAKVLGAEHPTLASSYCSLGSILDAQGKHAEAGLLLQKALRIHLQVLGEGHPDTATSYGNLAHNQSVQGKLAEAEANLRMALAIRSKSLGEEHAWTSNSYMDLAGILLDQGKLSAAISHLQAAARSYDSARVRMAGTGFERSLLQPDRTSPHAALALAQASLSEPRQAWQHAEAYLARGLLDDLDASSRLRDEKPARLDKLDDLLVPLVSRSSLSTDERERRDELLHERSAIRKALAQAAAERSAKRTWPLEKIQPALPANAALVLWLDVRKDHWACILKQRGEPIWQRLSGTGPGRAWTKDDIGLAVRAYEALIEPKHHEREKLVAALRAQRLDPLLPHLQGIQRLFVIPTDQMAKVPIEALTDQFTVSYTPSASYFAQSREQHRPVEAGPLLALGHPNFASPMDNQHTPPANGLLLTSVIPAGNAEMHGLKAGDILVTYNDKTIQSQQDLQIVTTGPHVPAEYWRDGATHRVRLEPGKLGVMIDKRPVAEAFVAWRQIAYTQVTQRSKPIEPLPGTKVEVEALAKLLPQTKLIVGSDASEQTLEQLAESGQLKLYRLLHFATHGEVNEGIPSESALILAQDQISRRLDDQLARSLGGKKPLDGRLTVGTILEKWQIDADQVVLSACETGLGRQGGGDGLLGFAQALLQKGAKSVVLSRWKVPDAATALLMQRYYQNILGKREGLKAPMGRAEGLREAKHWLRSQTQAEIEKQVIALPGSGELRGTPTPKPPSQAANKPTTADLPFAAPFYWAAFVLIGDSE